MALGLNIVVGFAGLLDLGYVAFYALGAYTVGWFGSGFFFNANVHVGVSHLQSTLPGIHFNFLLIVISAVLIASLAGIIIGLPTLRLRSDYIAIVTLAFGEIVRRVRGQRAEHPPGERRDADGGQPRHPCGRPALLPGRRLVQLAQAQTVVLADPRV